MNESPLLFNVLLLTVAEMRRLQQQLTPGAPWGLRMAVAAAEQEVDELVELHLTQAALAPNPEGGK